MKIKKESFGTTKNGEKAQLITVENQNGMKVVLTDYGANIVSIFTKDRNGVLADVVLGYDTLAAYEETPSYFGAFIGRHGNRIGGAKFTIGGKTYQVEANDNGNNLHGGSISYNRYMYETEIIEDEEEISVVFSRLSPDMEQGFPGNLDVNVCYTLTERNELLIEYSAATDKDTLVNLTNHSYFNLAGHNSGPVYDQLVTIDADYFTATDAKLIPTGELVPVEGTPMDFRKATAIGARIHDDYAPLHLGGGYDHNYVLNQKGEEDEICEVAKLEDPKSGRVMEVFTDLPGMQLYSGNFINGSISGKGGCTYGKRDGICFETQYFPNSCNIPSFRSCVLAAGEVFESATMYRFSVHKK